jgi:hypothetical protein
MRWELRSLPAGISKIPHQLARCYAIFYSFMRSKLHAGHGGDSIYKGKVGWILESLATTITRHGAMS